MVLLAAVTALVAAPIARVANSAEPSDIVVADFEDGYGDWTTEGDAFGAEPARGTLPNQMHVGGFHGERLVNSFLGGDRGLGTLTSAPFAIERDWLVFLIGGGEHVDRCGVELLVAGERVRSATGRNSEHLDWHSWDVRDLRGKMARLRVFDRHDGGWGHILFDRLLLSSERRRAEGEIDLDEYRRSDRYYREPYRPFFHFTPEIHWINDPNGLVHHEGEWHLFYQHNPFGIEWGHMSWGHAVSPDLVHWEHLPLALAEENGVMIFSGSAVVDHANTSGFGVDGRPPLVAIYTGHQPTNQSQHIAWSNDRGRTWTKYAGNPVIDIGEKDFRDPKVFWHEPTERWVMVVSLAAQKRVSFYVTENLREWEHASDFGPAGAENKPNWECPDLFPLVIDGDPQTTRWVLEVDMGSGAIAGGSGGEYFIGEFDGRVFRPDPLPYPLWVDYGRDFYAPISWSDAPDGRRVWLSWMNNWETCLVPTKPWRGAMSIPRDLALRTFDEGLRMVQTPVPELRALRDLDRAVLSAQSVSIERANELLAEAGAIGPAVEVVAQFWDIGAGEVGIDVRVGGGEATPIRYDAGRKELSVDRRRSGDVTFDARFPGRHAAPLPISNGALRLEVFVDSSSVEVFAERGRVVITDRIFPRPESDGMVFRGGEAVRVQFAAYPMRRAMGGR